MKNNCTRGFATPSFENKLSKFMPIVILMMLVGVGSALAQPAANPTPAPVVAAPTTAPVAGAPAEAPVPESTMWYQKLADQPWEQNENFWMPKAVNSAADDSDMMFYAVLGLSAFFFIAIAGAVIGMTIKYRHRPGHKAMPSPAHNDAMEITWTVIPTIICVFLFIYGWRGYLTLSVAPQRAVEIQAQAYQWQWEFTHANGVKDENLHVPVDTDVRMVMTSRDVLHSFYIPAFRVKQDLVPRRYTYTWFHATKPGVYRLNCTEYCGTSHSQMSKKVIVHEPGGYEKYLSEKNEFQNNLPPLELGKSLYVSKGCNACHSIDGSVKIGPSWKGTYGTTQKLLTGVDVVIDENYIRESILAPQAKARMGGQMPSFEGQLKEKELLGIIEYFKSLK
jgi:cytochrome c oxidase subunit II